MTVRERIYADPFCGARMELNVYEWYNREYWSDDLGLEIRYDLTFGDVFDCLYFEPEKIYECLGVGDTIIRERVFKKLAEYTKLECDDIYEMWLRM